MNKPMADHQHGGAQDEDPSLVSCNPRAANRPPTCGVHNQMIVGVDTVYLSHLPMFMFDPAHHEHNFQVIMEVTLGGPENAGATYANDRRKHPQERMYTMLPTAFELIELDPANLKRTTLTGDIFRGHLERDGRVIIPEAQVHVENILYFHEFDPDATRPEELEYLLFGKAPDLFLAHLITVPPDFDQILGVTIHGDAPSAAELEQGIRVTFPGRVNTPPTRIKAGEQVLGQATVSGRAVELQLETGTEFYFEEGELLEAAEFGQTREERKAGF